MGYMNGIGALMPVMKLGVAWWPSFTLQLPSEMCLVLAVGNKNNSNNNNS